MGCPGARSHPASETLGGPVSRAPGRLAGRAPSVWPRLLGEGAPLVLMAVNPLWSASPAGQQEDEEVSGGGAESPQRSGEAGEEGAQEHERPCLG